MQGEVLRYRSPAEREYDRLCELLDAMDHIAQGNDFYAVRSAIATQRNLLREHLGLSVREPQGHWVKVPRHG